MKLGECHGIHVGDRRHCFAIQAPSLARSSSCHPGLVAERHGLVLHRLGFDLGGIALEVFDGLECDALGRRLDRRIARRCGMASGAARGDDRQGLGISSLRPDRDCSFSGWVMSKASASAAPMSGKVQAMSVWLSPTSVRTRKCRVSAPPTTTSPASIQACG